MWEEEWASLKVFLNSECSKQWALREKGQSGGLQSRSCLLFSVHLWEKERWEVDEEDSKDKKPWPGVLLQSCREDVETALIMQYAHCRQIGGLGPSSSLISDSERKPLL